MVSEIVIAAMAQSRAERNPRAILHLWKSGYPLNDEEFDYLQANMPKSGGTTKNPQTLENWKRWAAFKRLVKTKRDAFGYHTFSKNIRIRKAEVVKDAIRAARDEFPDIGEALAWDIWEGKRSEASQIAKLMDELEAGNISQPQYEAEVLRIWKAPIESEKGSFS
jgi:hypothetical protein